MVRPHSMDLREHAMQRLATGETTYQVAAALNVAVSSVIKWAQKQKKSGSVEPGKMGGHKPFIIEGEHKTFLLNYIKQIPTASLTDLVQLLDKCGLKVHSSSVSRFLVREGINLKAVTHLEKVEQMNVKSADSKPVQLKLVQKAQPEKTKLEKTKLEKIKSKKTHHNQLEFVQPEQKAKEIVAKAVEVKTNIEELLDVPQQNGAAPQIEFFQMDINLPIKPVVASLAMLETVYKCRKEFYQTCFETWSDVYFSAFKR